MKTILSILLYLSLVPILNAQSLDMQQLGSIGGEIGSGSSTVLVHELGAVGSTVIDNGSNRLDQGMFLACDIPCDTIKVVDGIDRLIYEQPLISAYPNPTAGILFLKGKSHLIQQYEINSPIGQLIAKGEIRDKQISFFDLPPGIYLLRVYSREGELSLLQKVIRQ